MSIVCNMLTAVGLTLGGTCAEPTTQKMDLPSEDGSVWTYRAPEKPTPEPKPLPVFPTVTVERVVIKEVAGPAPAAPKVKPKPKPQPDPYRLWLEARRGLQFASLNPSQEWTEIDVTPAKGVSGSPDSFTANPTSSFSPPQVEKPTYDFEHVLSSEPVSNDRVITTDRYITGIIEGGINSQLSSKEGGQVIIQVSRDVFGYGTRNKLIPKGSRLVCDYESPTSLNATRFAIKCIRILLAGDKKGHRVEIAQLEAPVSDSQGRGGSSGTVNNHFGEQYGTAIMLSMISSAVRGSSAMFTSKDGESTTTADIADKASQELGTRFGEISASVLEKTTNIVPTITSAQGKRVQIRPRKDWYLKEVKS